MEPKGGKVAFLYFCFYKKAEKMAAYQSYRKTLHFWSPIAFQAAVDIKNSVF